MAALAAGIAGGARSREREGRTLMATYDDLARCWGALDWADFRRFQSHGLHFAVNLKGETRVCDKDWNDCGNPDDFRGWLPDNGDPR